MGSLYQKEELLKLIDASIELIATKSDIKKNRKYRDLKANPDTIERLI